MSAIKRFKVRWIFEISGVIKDAKSLAKLINKNTEYVCEPRNSDGVISIKPLGLKYGFEIIERPTLNIHYSIREKNGKYKPKKNHIME